MPLIPSTGFELFSYLWNAPHGEEDMDMQPGRKVASNPQLFHSHNYKSLERLIPKCFSRFIPQRGFCSVPQILVPSTLSYAAGCLPRQLNAILEGLDVQIGRVMGYGGSCTTSASPSGMSQTHLGILKGMETYF